MVFILTVESVSKMDIKFKGKVSAQDIVNYFNKRMNKAQMVFIENPSSMSFSVFTIKHKETGESLGSFFATKFMKDNDFHIKYVEEVLGYDYIRESNK